MKKKIKDRHLDVPTEANRDKHINFVALERGETDPSDEPPTGRLIKEKEKKSQSKQSITKRH
jgi:hypothetical protein